MSPEQIHSFFRWAWLNPHVLIPLSLVNLVLIICLLFKLLKVHSNLAKNVQCDKKSLIKIVLLGICVLSLFIMTSLLGFSFSPMEFPSLFGDPNNYYILVK